MLRWGLVLFVTPPVMAVLGTAGVMTGLVMVAWILATVWLVGMLVGLCAEETAELERERRR